MLAIILTTLRWISNLSARTFYNAARIHAKIIYSRDHCNELWLESHKAATAPPSSSAPPTVHMIRPPMSPDRNVDGDMVNLGSVIDGRKGRETTVAAPAIYNKGLEWYTYACWDEPGECSRPSIQQYTCVLELKCCGSMYADYSLFAPHDVRTAKSRNFEGLVVGSDGYLCKNMYKGPPGSPTYMECGSVHECSLIMAKMITPARIAGYFKKMSKLSENYCACWALQYQRDDRLRHEQLPELYRKEYARYDRRVARYGTHGGYGDEESQFGPDYPLDHLLWMSANAEVANKWLQENFVWQADKILNKVKTLDEFLDGDAPIATNRENHAITSFH